MSKRNKFILILLIAIIAGCLAYYFLIYRKQPAASLPAASPRYGFLPPTLQRLFGRGGSSGVGGGAGGNGQPKTTPVSAAERQKQRLYRLSSEPAFGPAVFAQNNSVRYFSKSGGQLWEADFEGLQIKRVTDAPLQNMVEAIWSRAGDKAIITLMDVADTPQKYLFDAATKKSTELNHYIRSAAFSPKGDRIVYHYLNTLNGDDAVAIAKPDGTNFKNIFHPLFDDFTLSWPKEETIIIQTKPSYLAETLVYALDSRTGTLTKVLPQNYPGLATAWSGNGARVLASRTDSDGKLQNMLAGTYPQTQLRELFSTPTMAEKCVWKNDVKSAICGIPTNIPVDAALPDAYYNGTVLSIDDVREVNMETLAVRTQARAQDLFPNLDIDEPVLSPDETKLFFINRRDGFIYALRLQP